MCDYKAFIDTDWHNADIDPCPPIEIYINGMAVGEVEENEILEFSANVDDIIKFEYDNCTEEEQLLVIQTLAGVDVFSFYLYIGEGDYAKEMFCP